MITINWFAKNKNQSKDMLNNFSAEKKIKIAKIVFDLNSQNENPTKYKIKK